MRIGSLSNAARTALSGMDNVYRELDNVAKTVAAGVKREPGAGGEFSSALVKLPELRRNARANAAVASIAETLLSELGSLPRR